MIEKYKLVTGDDGNPALEITRTERRNMVQTRNALVLLQKGITATEKRLGDMRLQAGALGEIVDQSIAKPAPNP